MSVKNLITVIKANSFFPKHSWWVFSICLIITSFTYDYQDVLFRPTQSIHQWRQCDCLSITMNYYQDNNPFLQPSVHYLGADGTGKTISECPLIYYSVASLWKVFGHHEFIYRMLVLLIYFIGLFSVFKLFENKLKDSIWAMICSLLLFTSPTLVYYANNFLMDIPALSLAMVGLYFFFRFEQSGSNKFLYWSALFYTIAGLLKVSALLSFAAIIGLFALELVNVTLRSDRKVFHQPLKQAAVFAGVLLIQYAWYSYASF